MRNLASLAVLAVVSWFAAVNTPRVRTEVPTSETPRPLVSEVRGWCECPHRGQYVTRHAVACDEMP